MPKICLTFNNTKKRRLVLGASLDDIVLDAWKLQVLGQKVLGCKRTNQVRISYDGQDLTLSPLANVHYDKLGKHNLPHLSAYSPASKYAWLKLQQANSADLLLWQYSHDECMLARMTTAETSQLVDCYTRMHKRHRRNADIFLAGFKRQPQLALFVPPCLLDDHRVACAIAKYHILRATSDQLFSDLCQIAQSVSAAQQSNRATTHDPLLWVIFWMFVVGLLRIGYVVGIQDCQPSGWLANQTDPTNQANQTFQLALC
jgi:hypothetical protein